MNIKTIESKEQLILYTSSLFDEIDKFEVKILHMISHIKVSLDFFPESNEIVESLLKGIRGKLTSTKNKIYEDIDDLTSDGD